MITITADELRTAMKILHSRKAVVILANDHHNAFVFFRNAEGELTYNGVSVCSYKSWEVNQVIFFPGD